MNRKWLIRALHWIGPVLLIVLILKAGPGRLASALAAADWRWLALGFVLNIPQLGLKALRWWMLVRWQRIPFTYTRAFLSYFSALLVGFLTPGRIGEMAKALSLKYEGGAPLAKGLSSVVIDRVFDMYLLLGLGSIGIIRFAVVGEQISWPAFALVCAALIAALGLLNQNIFVRAAALAGGLPFFSRRTDWLSEKSAQFAGGLAVLTPGRVLICAGLTAAAYSIFFVQCLCCALALGFTVPFRDLVLMMSATNFISFVPITLSGLGTREACLTFFLARTIPSQPMPVAVSFGLAIFIVLFVGGGLIGWACWQAAPLGMRQAVAEVRQRRKGPAGKE